LIAVNPFKTLSIYTSSVLKEYHTRNPNAQTQKAPHVYSVISGAYWSMGEEGKDQSVLISGESGSGKTETTKIVLQFLSEVAGSETSVEQQVMSSNPILEAFGNAKTLRNNNSSRFGKWMEIKFNDQRIMCGARINNYLLEKSRVVKQAQGERNYHYFYQLCSGVSEQLRSKFSIWKADKFNYLNQSGSLSIEGVNDAFEFAEVLTSFQKLDFKESEIEAIIGSVAAVLHLGNLILESKVVNGTEQSYVSNRDQIALVGRVLQIDPDLLEESICFRTMFMKTETQKIYLRVDQALDSRDSLAKAIYGNLFDWLVSKINNFLGVNLKGHMRMIGVLDIFGFEVFEKNSFEQLCINFANETLQLYFNDFIFKMEQDEYKTECVSVERVGFVDNIETTELISSMLQMIDEEILLPKGSDSTFLEKANSQYASSKTKPAHPSYVIHKTSTNNFSIKHYAGGVIYTTDNFLEKSKDSIHDSLLSCIRKSSNSLIQMLFADNTLDTKELGASGPINLNGTLSASQSRSKLGSMLKKKSQTLGSKFKQQLDVLMENIKNTSPHFIRCVKPNSAKKPNIFESNLVLQQLRYAGLFEAVRIRAAGYSFRRPFLSFANRYAVLTSKEDRKKFLNIKVDPKDEFASSAAARQKVDLVLSSTKLENDPNICLGKSKVFYRSEVMKNLEKLRDNQYLKSAIRLQSVIRSSLARWTLKKLRKIRVESLKAIKEGDLNSLQSIVKFAEESKLYSKIQNEILKDLEYLVEEGKIVTLLENAIQISDINQLEAGIQQAEKLMLPEKTKSSKTKKVIGDAIQLKESILKLKDFKNKLNIAVQSSNISDIKQLLDILGKFDSKKLADFKELIHTAQSIVSDFEAQQKPFDNLQSFMQGIKDRLFEVNEIRNVMGLISDCEKISKMNPIRVEQVTQARTLMLKSARAPLEVNSAFFFSLFNCFFRGPL
jgi:myosin-7